MNTIKNLTTASVLLLATLLLPQLQAQTLPFETSTVSRQQVPEVRWFDGTIEAVQQTTVSAQTSARITEILFDVDDFVEAGAVIVRFDDSEARAAVAQAEGQLAAAVATRDGAQREFTRMKKLHEDGMVARSAYDSARAAYNATRANEDSASASVDRAREQLQYTEVKAPYSGLVTARHVELGELANPGQPLMSGLSLQHLRVTTSVPQRVAEQIRNNDNALIETSNGQVVSTERLTVFPVANNVTHTVTVRANLPEETESVFPGMLVRVGFETDTRSRVLIPQSALVRRGELTGVYRVGQDNRVSLQQVRAARLVDSDQIEIVSGLHDGDVIATDPIAATRFLTEQARAAQ